MSRNEQNHFMQISLTGPASKATRSIISKLMTRRHNPQYTPMMRTHEISSVEKSSLPNQVKITYRLFGQGSFEYFQTDIHGYDPNQPNARPILIMIDLSEPDHLDDTLEWLELNRQTPVPIYLVANSIVLHGGFSLPNRITDEELQNCVRDNQLAGLIKIDSTNDTRQALEEKILGPLSSQLLGMSNQPHESHAPKQDAHPPSDKESLIRRLQTYAKHRFNPAQDLASARPRLWAPQPTQAFNRMINARLASELIEAIKAGDNIHELFESGNLSTRRATLVEQHKNSNGYNTLGRYRFSKELKETVHEARSIAAQETANTENDTDPSPPSTGPKGP